MVNRSSKKDRKEAENVMQAVLEEAVGEAISEVADEMLNSKGTKSEKTERTENGPTTVGDPQEESVVQGESKSDAFRRISAPRLNRITDDVRILTKCADVSRYEYSAEDVEMMFDFLQTALEKSKEEFLRSIKASPFMPEFKWTK